MLSGLITATGLEPVWCTSWRKDATRLIGPRLGLPPWPNVHLPHQPLTSSHPHGYLWKRDYVAEHACNQPLAWIDDDFAEPADHDWARTRTASGLPTLLIQPNPQDGIQPHHIELVRQWALQQRSARKSAQPDIPPRLGHKMSPNKTRLTWTDLV
jgi:hypothetical protein